MPYPRGNNTSTHYVGGRIDPKAGLDDLKRDISCLCWDSNPVVGGYANYIRKAVEAYCLPLWRYSSGEAKENHVNLSTVNVDIPSGSDGYFVHCWLLVRHGKKFLSRFSCCDQHN
jgi:hypothetical protein